MIAGQVQALAVIGREQKINEMKNFPSRIEHTALGEDFSTPTMSFQLYGAALC